MHVRLPNIFGNLLFGLSLTVPLTAHGLGFGDISVSSGLGQPLRAYIMLLDPPADITPNCFKLKELPDSGLALPPGIHLEIDRQPGTKPRLKITSGQPVNEPALGFIAASVCEIQLGREYTVLLDPVVEVEPAAIVQPLATPAPVETLKRETPPNPSRAAPSAPASVKPVSTIPDSRSQKPANVLPRKKTIIHKSVPKKDLLVLSHGNSPSQVQEKDLASPPEKSLTLEEIADENTALSLKLNNLEEQLSALQKRHADLVAQMQVAARLKAEEDSSHNWIYFALFGTVFFLLVSALLLHRQNRQQPARFITPKMDVQHIRRASSESRIPGMQMESMPAATEDMSPELTDLEIPEHIPGNPEIHDGLEDEVEVFVAHGQHSLAIRLLEDHIRHNPSGSPAPWLLLLDLLQRAKDSTKYEEIRKLCRRHFNIIIPTYESCETGLPTTGIESYQHVLAELIRLWPSNKADSYLDELLYDNRGGNRVGFDPNAYHEILLLRDIRQIVATS